MRGPSPAGESRPPEPDVDAKEGRPKDLAALPVLRATLEEKSRRPPDRG